VANRGTGEEGGRVGRGGGEEMFRGGGRSSLTLGIAEKGKAGEPGGGLLCRSVLLLPTLIARGVGKAGKGGLYVGLFCFVFF